MKKIRWGLTACAAALSLVLVGGVASAQQKAPDAPAKQAAPAAKKAAPAAKKATAAKKPKRTPSACAGITQDACAANAECTWFKEVTTKKGQKRKAHCQKKPKPPVAKKVGAPKAAAPKAAPAAKKQ
ncbi:MAG: hypothetical protein R3D68_18955 [Hyphomicrobiaceae bacterium]